MSLVLPVLAGFILVTLAVLFALSIARKRRARAEQFLEREMGLLAVEPRAGFGRTQWFSGDVRGRRYVAGLVAMSSPGVGRRSQSMFLGFVMPIRISPPLSNISHRGQYEKEDGDPFDAMFKLMKGATRPDAAVTEPLVEFARQHGRINLWTRARGAFVLPTVLFADTKHLLAWMVPVWPTKDDVRPGLEALTRLAETLERD